MKKIDYAKYLRLRQQNKSFELSQKLNISEELYLTCLTNTTDDQLIESYIKCEGCGNYCISIQDMEELIQKHDDPDLIFNLLFNDCAHDTNI